MPDMYLIRTLSELAAHAYLCAADPAASTIDQLVARHPAAKYACPMTAAEIAAMHATRWDGD